MFRPRFECTQETLPLPSWLPLHKNHYRRVPRGTSHTNRYLIDAFAGQILPFFLVSRRSTLIVTFESNCRTENVTL